MLDKADNVVGQLSESVARRMTRRSLIFTGTKGAVAAMAGVTLGVFLSPTGALASNPGCTWIGGSGNANCPSVGGSCPSHGGCKSGCTPCTSSDWCSGWCNYGGASWDVGSCGTCGGWYQCTDCKCTTCSNICTCESLCICSGCCSPKQVLAEKQARALHMNALIAEA